MNISTLFRRKRQERVLSAVEQIGNYLDREAAGQKLTDGEWLEVMAVAAAAGIADGLVEAAGAWRADRLRLQQELAGAGDAETALAEAQKAAAAFRIETAAMVERRNPTETKLQEAVAQAEIAFRPFRKRRDALAQLPPDPLLPSAPVVMARRLTDDEGIAEAVAVADAKVAEARQRDAARRANLAMEREQQPVGAADDERQLSQLGQAVRAEQRRQPQQATLR